jgi:hypothetical protein
MSSVSIKAVSEIHISLRKQLSLYRHKVENSGIPGRVVLAKSQPLGVLSDFGPTTLRVIAKAAEDTVLPYRERDRKFSVKENDI